MRMGLGLAGVVLLALACGGGGGGGGDGGGDPTLRTWNVFSDPARDGWASLGGVVRFTAEGGLVPRVGELSIAGGTWNDLRQLYTFDFTGLPAGATIERATLRLYQARTQGDAYSQFAGVVVDHVYFDPVEGIVGGVFDGQAYARAFDLLSTGEGISYHAVDATSQVRGDLSRGRTLSQFRIRFSTPSPLPRDGVADCVYFTDAEDTCCGVARPPTLVLEYWAP